jgi:hypothetical protein
VSIEGLLQATLWESGQEAEGRASLIVDVEPDRLREIKVFIRQERSMVRAGSTRFSFRLADEGTEATSEATDFFGPET